MPEHERAEIEEARETFSYTLPPSLATQVAVYAAETRQNKSRALEAIIREFFNRLRGKKEAA